VIVAVVLYATAFNVFITFSLSHSAWCGTGGWNRANTADLGKENFGVNGFGLLLTSGILISLCVVKFSEGGLGGRLFVTQGFWLPRRILGERVITSRTQHQLQRLNELVARRRY